MLSQKSKICQNDFFKIFSMINRSEYDIYKYFLNK